MKSKKVALIPTRLASKRKPGRALVKICDIPIIVHIAKRLSKSNALDEIIVITDSNEILEVCNKYKIKTDMTKGNFKNGTERASLAAEKISFDWGLVIKGDDPFIDPKIIDEICKLIDTNDQLADVLITTKKSKYKHDEEIINVQKTLNSKVMTLSRSILPFRYENKIQFVDRFLEISAYKKDVLLKYKNMEIGINEHCEEIDVLRPIENGFNVFAHDSNYIERFGIYKDEVDLLQTRMQSDDIFKSYKHNN